MSACASTMCVAPVHVLRAHVQWVPCRWLPPKARLRVLMHFLPEQRTHGTASPDQRLGTAAEGKRGHGQAGSGVTTSCTFQPLPGGPVPLPSLHPAPQSSSSSPST